MTEQTILLGYRIIGSLWLKYKADAIVIPPLDLHKKYLLKRHDLVVSNVINIRNLIVEHSEKHNIPLFDSIIKAKNYLENKLEKKVL